MSKQNNMQKVHKRSSKKQSRKTNQGSPMGLVPVPKVASYPASQRVVLTYPVRISFTESAANSGATYFFRLNSVFDPDFTGVGGLALGLTYWQQLYANYRVNRVTMRVSGNLQTCTGGSIAELALVPVAGTATLPANSNTWALRPGVKTMFLTLGDRPGQTITATWDLHKVLGITRQQYLDEMDFSALTNNNPTRQAYAAVAFTVSGSSIAATVATYVYISYQVEFFNPIPQQ